ncbi:hypothetical protein KCP73_03400 [Salmonella enterica subsp. enterica]|nr:hypothetical protein KCP73_03400 [Salmonella enterica subsp. enterica]
MAGYGARAPFIFGATARICWVFWVARRQSTRLAFNEMVRCGEVSAPV